MNKEIREKNKETRSRVRELKEKNEKLAKLAEEKFQSSQKLQQEIAQINTERLKVIGAIEELERVIA